MWLTLSARNQVCTARNNCGRTRHGRRCRTAWRSWTVRMRRFLQVAGGAERSRSGARHGAGAGVAERACLLSTCERLLDTGLVKRRMSYCRRWCNAVVCGWDWKQRNKPVTNQEGRHCNASELKRDRSGQTRSWSAGSATMPSCLRTQARKLSRQRMLHDCVRLRLCMPLASATTAELLRGLMSSPSA